MYRIVYITFGAETKPPETTCEDCGFVNNFIERALLPVVVGLFERSGPDLSNKPSIVSCRALSGKNCTNNCSSHVVSGKRISPGNDV